jgi:endo-1,3(4)-beta-glucanase
MTNLLTPLARISLILLLGIFISQPAHSQFVPVGSGSYTTTFPGVDAANRNTYPSGAPITTGPAASRPVPTNDWWSAKIKNDHADNLFSYPYTLKTINQGLVVTYIPWGVIDNIIPVTVGVTGLNASAARVADFSDWTVTMDWQNGSHHFQATAGIGMPFLYFSKDSSDVAAVEVTQGTVSLSGEMMIIEDARNGADFVVYGPTGSSWTKNGNTYTSSLNGKNYWSMAFIPQSASNITAIANQYKKYAYVFPKNTLTNWNYDAATGVVRTDFEVETEVKEGTDSTILMGLLPHQWANLAGNSPAPNGYSYTSIRGELKTLDGNAFSVENTFHGILPTLPYLDYYSQGFSPAKLNSKVNLIKNDQLSTWTDSYNEGQVMNRLIQTARIAELMGDTLALQSMLQTVKERLEDWLTAEANEVAFIFYYNQTWSAMIGYPAGHGQDGNLNDHHFHWGYFIHAAAFLEQFEPGWAGQWGEMINLLVQDAACSDRNNSQFPFLRNFSPYAGHCWANGFASFPQGNDQESTSESMQFNSSLIHWGSITGNDSIRDLGIYLYTTEQSAIEEYWFDMHNRVFLPNQQYGMVSRVWGNSYDNGTFWTSDIAASYGIEMYPIHGGSLYLGQDTAYVDKIWKEIEQYTGILNNEVNPNLWHDVKWKYLAFIDPAKAISMYDSYPERSLKFGVSDAQTYHWLHAMNVLGRVDASLTANHPLAAAFRKGSDITYTAHNYGNDSLQVVFSDGFSLSVPPHRFVTSKDIDIKGVLSSSFSAAYPGGSVQLQVQVSQGTPTKIEFVDGETVIGQLSQAPFTFEASGLTVGKHSFYARIYDGSQFSITNFAQVVVGEQLPWAGEPIPIPGTFESAHYDVFEGGIGEGIAYHDVSPENAGDFRLDQYVDAVGVANEGATVGWIAPGEWLEYTIDVQQAGFHKLEFRYACGNNAGGGPLRLELNGDSISPAISVSYTGDWTTWQTHTVNNIPLKSGKQVLRVIMENGEFNLGKLSFSYEAPLTYNQPVADAGPNLLVQLPLDTTLLDGSNSQDPGSLGLSYQWTQVYGPSVLSFSDPLAAQPSVSGLKEGVYLVKLRVDNGSYADEDELYLISSTQTNVAPKVSILSPSDQAKYIEDEPITVSAVASDLIGEVTLVEFYANNDLIGSATAAPYSLTWAPKAGLYDLIAVAQDDDSSRTTSKTIE